MKRVNWFLNAKKNERGQIWIICTWRKFFIFCRMLSHMTRNCPNIGRMAIPCPKDWRAWARLVTTDWKLISISSISFKLNQIIWPNWSSKCHRPKWQSSWKPSFTLCLITEPIKGKNSCYWSCSAKLWKRKSSKWGKWGAKG